MRLNRVSLFAALAIVSVASNLMALQPGQSVTFGSVTLQANTPRLFGPGSVGAGGSNLALTVTVPNADAVNPATQITFHLARSFDGGTTWVQWAGDTTILGSPLNDRHHTGLPIQLGISYSTNGQAFQVRMTVTSATKITTQGETIALDVAT